VTDEARSISPSVSALAVAAAFLLLSLAVGSHYRTYGFLVVMTGVGLVAYLYPGRLRVHLRGGILPVVALAVVIVLTRRIDVHTPYGVWHGPALWPRAAAVVLLNIPPVIGLLLGDRLGRRRMRRRHDGVEALASSSGARI
jgi:hypothetical protein